MDDGEITVDYDQEQYQNMRHLEEERAETLCTPSDISYTLLKAAPEKDNIYTVN